MKKLWLTVSCIVLLLGGCLDVENYTLSLDLKNNTVEVSYSNIVSNSDKEKDIKSDFEDLLKTAYGDENKVGKTISKKLYEESGHLDGVAKFSYKDNAEMLKEYEIETDKKGDFILDLSKGGNKDLDYTGGNGTYVEEGEKRFIRWDSNSASLKATLKNKAFDAKNKSLLSYWLEWKEKNPK
jgi:hypothetical protein